jgi:hypothetical protein
MRDRLQRISEGWQFRETQFFQIVFRSRQAVPLVEGARKFVGLFSVNLAPTEV